MIVGSCSTTITVFPAFFNRRSTASSRSLSRACSPTAGSSTTYIVSVNEDPRAVALRARLVAAVLRQLHADVDLVLLRLQPLEEALDPVPLPAAVVEEVPLRGRQLLDRHVEAQPVFLRRFLEVLVAILVARRVPRRDRQLVEAQGVVGDHLLHVDADDPAVALALRAGAERRVE